MGMKPLSVDGRDRHFAALMRRYAGFTLIELAAALALMILVAVLVIPNAVLIRDDAEDRAEVQRFITELRRARSAAVTRSDATGSGTAAIRSAGITVLSPTQYVRFTDNDLANGGEVTQAAVDISGSRLTIVTPLAGDQIRFRNDGTRLSSSPGQIRLESPSGRFFTVNVNLTGLSRID